MRAKKSLGQNFLKSTAVVNIMVESAGVTEHDTVLEIGPGKGALTQGVLDTGAKVVAIEKDSDLIPVLHNKFKSQTETGQLNIINADISDLDVNELFKDREYKLIANIPYYITGEILRSFLESEKQPTSMTLLVQKEVAERIIARNGKNSILSISVKAYGTPHYIKKVPARLFSPQPKVDSAILHIENISKKFFEDNSIIEKDFFNIVKKGFSQKRKQLKNNLKIPITELSKLNLPEQIRAEDLTLQDWAKLTHLYHGME